jgi:hypothetical protein
MANTRALLLLFSLFVWTACSCNCSGVYTDVEPQVHFDFEFIDSSPLAAKKWVLRNIQRYGNPYKRSDIDTKYGAVRTRFPSDGKRASSLDERIERSNREIARLWGEIRGLSAELRGLSAELRKCRHGPCPASLTLWDYMPLYLPTVMTCVVTVCAVFVSAKRK